MDVLKTSFVDVPSVYVVHFEDFAAVHRDQNCAPFRIPANARNSPVQAPEGAGIELFYPLPQRIPQMHFTIGPKDWVSTRPKPPEDSVKDSSAQGLFQYSPFASELTIPAPPIPECPATGEPVVRSRKITVQRQSSDADARVHQLPVPPAVDRHQPSFVRATGDQ